MYYTITCTNCNQKEYHILEEGCNVISCDKCHVRHAIDVIGQGNGQYNVFVNILIYCHGDIDINGWPR